MKRNNDLFYVHELSLFPQTCLPSKFKMPVIDKFGGIKSPNTYIKFYIKALQPIGINEDLMA